MSDQHEKPVAYVDFDRCIVVVDPAAQLLPDDRSEKQKLWDDMVIKCEVDERDGFFVDLREYHPFFHDTIYYVCDSPPVTTYPRTIDAEGMMLTRVTSFGTIFESREYAEDIARRAFGLFKAARANWHECEKKIKALKHQRSIYGATHAMFDHNGGLISTAPRELPPADPRYR